MKTVKVKWHPEKFNKALNKELNRRVERSAIWYSNYIKSYAPSKDGTLRDSFFAHKIGNMRYMIGTDVIYAKFIEYGTSKMPANPFMRRSLRGFTTILRRIFK